MSTYYYHPSDGLYHDYKPRYVRCFSCGKESPYAFVNKTGLCPECLDKEVLQHRAFVSKLGLILYGPQRPTFNS